MSRHSKYSDLTMDEYKAIKREQHNQWLKKQPEEKIQQYKNIFKRHCDICNVDPANIYKHIQTKKHIRNLENSKQNKNLKTKTI